MIASMRRGLVCLFLALVIAFVGKGWHWAKDGFTVGRIAVCLAEESGPVLPLDPELAAALKQRFFYLGRGHQNYAFVSFDGQYVLKLPRYDLYRPPFWLRACPFLSDYRTKWIAEKERRKRFLMNSFRIAFQDLKEETSLLFLHLGKTDHLKQTVQMRDRVGRSFSIDLDQSGFLLQKRHDLMMPLYAKSLLDGEKEKAKNILEAFLELNAVRARKGIYNKDPSFLRNFAIAEGDGIQIDVGSFYRLESGDFSSSFLQTVGHVQDWLEESDPEVKSWFEKRTAEIVEGELK